MSRRFIAGLLTVGGLLSGAPALASAPAEVTGPVRMNEVQVMATHNSYHQELSGPEQTAFDIATFDYGRYGDRLAYSHVPLPEQLGRQAVRGVELDLYPDPAGGLYEKPLIHRLTGGGSLGDPQWREPGIKALHIADLDYRTNCVLFTACLRGIRDWSARNPRHEPVYVLLELKATDGRIETVGGAKSPPWNVPALDDLDAQIRSVFGEDEMITPDDVRVPGLTLEQSVLQNGWPTLNEARGSVVFLMDNEGGPGEAYVAGRPNLEDRVLFTNSLPGRPDAAFVKRNDPLALGHPSIAELVRLGYLVRTRADIPLATVRSGDRAMLDAALASGAQIVSTDFPEPGMSERYGTDYVAMLPGGNPARCNPVSARPDCRLGR